MSIPNPPIIGYENLLRQGLLSSNAGTPASAVDWRLDRAWQPGTTTSWLEVSLNAARPANYCALIGHNLAGGSLRVRSYIGSSYQTVATISPASAHCRMLFFNTVSSNRWRIECTTTSATILALVAVGQSLPLDSGLRQGFVPPPFTQQAEVVTTASQHGLPLGRSLRKRAGRLTINCTDLDEQWMRSEWLAFRAHALALPFFLSWNPEQFPHEAGLCWAESAPAGNAYTQPGFMDGNMSCRVLTEVVV
jgi:hypothetical protein